MWEADVVWSRALAVFAAVVLPGALVLCVPLSHDENMYIAAGVLLGEHTLYADFAYLQAPYLPLLYALVFDLTDQAYLLFCGRMVALVMALVAFYVVYRTCRELSGSRRLGALCVVLFAGHHLTLFVLPYARNHVVALALSLSAFYLFVRAVRSPRHGAALSALAGVLSGLAVGTRLMAAPLALALLVACLITPRLKRMKHRLAHGLLPFSLGLALSLVPAVWIIATTDAGAAWFDNVGYHGVNLLWRSAADPARAMTLPGKLAFAAEYLVKGSGASLLIAFGLVLWHRRYTTSRALVAKMASRADATTVATLCLAAAVLAAFLPTPMQRDYLAMVVPFAVIMLACLMGRWAVPYDRLLMQAVTGLAALTVLVALATNLRYLRYLPYPGRWAPIAVRQAGQRLAQLASRTGAPAKVATLSPIYPLEGGLEIYPELATGPFLYRVGDLIESGRRERYVGSSPKSIRALLAADPPDAILLGFEGTLEDPLAAFAQEHGYILVDTGMPRGQVYLRRPPGHSDTRDGD
jgi:hypothetical protein